MVEKKNTCLQTFEICLISNNDDTVVIQKIFTTFPFKSTIGTYFKIIFGGHLNGVSS